MEKDRHYSSLKGKNAIVTGGGAGIGRQIVLLLAAEGANIAIIDIDKKSSAKVAEEVESVGVKCRTYTQDLSVPMIFTGLMDQIEQDLGEIDILVNNAGITFTTKIPDMKPETWDLVLGINARATFFMSQAVFAKMIPRSRGRVINIASISGDRPALFSDAAYCASKAAMIMITKVFAKEAVNTAITVNSVSPGIIETEMTKRLGSTVSAANIPLARMGYASEIADAVLFLSSDQASYITGQNIRVNGGAYMG